jgi:predicted membrane channel-forming protein YqfA (hemolysin III family)
METRVVSPSPRLRKSIIAPVPVASCLPTIYATVRSGRAIGGRPPACRWGRFLGCCWVWSGPKTSLSGKVRTLRRVALLGMGVERSLGVRCRVQPPSGHYGWIYCVGGVLYSGGVVFHLWDRMRCQNAVWHAFVISAAVFQFLAVFNLVSTAASAGG